MANPIQRDELISKDALEALKDMSHYLEEDKKNMDALMEGFKQYAAAVKEATAANSGNNEELAKALKKIDDLEKAYADLQKLMKENEATQKAVNAEKKKYIELSEKETSDLEVLQKVLKENENLWAAAARSINTTNMSYNAMKATLTELQKKMRTFEDEEKKNSEAAVEMANAIDRLKAGMKQADDAQRSLNIGVDNLRSALAKGTDEVKLYQLNAIQPATSSFNDMKEKLGVLTEAYNKMSATQREGTEVGQLLGAKIKELNEGIKAYKQSLTETASATQQTNTAKRESNKLTEEEIKRIEELKAALAEEGQARMDAVNGIAVETMSYNELYATYNTLKDSLNRMTTEERLNTEAGKAMTAQAMQVYETMNQLQQSTGKYILQVGKYKSAFDGLGSSFQQILREAPSALNLNQFFLAISNNIPQFMDQLTSYNNRQKEIKAELDRMVEAGETGTEAYGKLLDQVEHWSKRLIRSILSWQSVILLLTMAIRFLPKIVDWIKSLFNHLKVVSDEFSNMIAKARIMRDAINDTAKVASELNLIGRELRFITQGTERWAAMVARVNELTGSNLNTLTATKNELDEVISKYIVFQRQMAVNSKVFEQLGEDTTRRADRTALMRIGSLEGAKQYLGWDENKDVENRFDTDKAFARLAKYQKDIDEWQQKLETARKRLEEAQANGNANAVKLYADSVKQIKGEIGQLQWLQDELATKINKNFGEIVIPSIMSDSRRKALEGLVKIEEDPFKTEKTGRTRKVKEYDYSPSDVDDEYWKAEQARIRMMEKGYDMEIDLQRVKHQEMLEQNDVWQGKREEQLMDDLMGELTLLTNGNEKAAETMYNAIVKNDTEAVQKMSAGAQRLATKFWSDMEEGQRQHDLIMQGLIIDNDEAIKAINQKYDKEQMDAIQAQYKAEMKVVARRSRTVTQEQQRNNGLIYNINVLRQEIEALTNAQYKDNDSKEEAAKRVETLNNEIEKLRKQMDFSKELALPGSFWELLQKKGAFDASPDTMKKIVGKFLPDMVGEMDEEQIESAFETITKNVGTATKEWYNTTIGYIQDLISAYVELANAKAEAAAEATEAAQEEYDKEKALLEAGYASRVEATWAEYQEKKAAQEKAEADAKAAAQTENDINEALTMGNLVSASAKIWEAFAAWPPVAIAALGTMWGSFAAAKIKAAEVSKYGEGGFEVLEGGSHASGHDIDLGIHNRRGRRMRAEGDEGIGIFSRKAMRHYGAESIEAMVNSVNRLEFEGNAAKRMNIERSIGMAVLSAPRTDLRRVESSLDKLVQYGSRNVVVEPDGSILEYRKNGVVRIKKA